MKDKYIINGRGIIFLFALMAGSLLSGIKSQHLTYDTSFVQGLEIKGLTGASSIAVDQTDNNVYIGSNTQHTVEVFRKEYPDGSLIPVQFIKDDENGVDGLKGAGTIILSSNRKHVYVAGTQESSIAVFQRNSSTGTLTFLEAKKEYTGEVGTLGYILSMSFSADGKYLYTAGFTGGAIFSRNQTTGALTYIGFFDRGTPSDYFFPFEVKVSSNGKHVYALGIDSAISVFNRNTMTGALTYSTKYKNNTNGITGMSQPKNITILPSTPTRMYLSSSRDSTLFLFSCDTSSGVLTLIESYKQGQNGISGLFHVNSIVINEQGSTLYTVCTQDSSVSVFNADPETGLLSFNTTYRQGQNGVTGLRNCTNAVISAYGELLYVTANNSVTTFDIDAINGTLTFKKITTNSVIGNSGLNKPSVLAADHTGKNLYIGSSLSNSISVYGIDGTTADLTFKQTLKDGENGIDGLRDVQAIVFSPSQQHVYVAGRLDFSIVVFNRNLSTGMLTFIEKTGDISTVGIASSMCISSDGKFLYSVGLINGIAVYSRATNGMLTYVNNYSRGFPNENFSSHKIRISEDDNFLYTLSNDSSISIFSRDPLTGAPAYITRVHNNEGGITRMTKPMELIVPHYLDEKFVYVSSPADSSVHVFERNVTTGMLTHVESYTQGINDMTGLSSINSFRMHTGGAHLLLTSSKDSSITILDRDFVTGKLYYAGTYKQSGAPGLNGCTEAISSENGEYVFTAGFGKDAIGKFNFDYAPFVPLNLEATANEESIELSWDAGLEWNLASYKVFRNTENNYYTSTHIGTVTANANGNSYDDENVTHNVTYYYWIKAVNATGIESWYGPKDTAMVRELVTGLRNGEAQLLSVYPNPAGNILNIELPLTGITKLNLIDVQGFSVKQQELTQEKTQINLSTLRPGIYFLELTNENSQWRKKIVKSE